MGVVKYSYMHRRIRQQQAVMNCSWLLLLYKNLFLKKGDKRNEKEQSKRFSPNWRLSRRKFLMVINRGLEQ
jgi:hypothetical protein